MKTAPAPSLDTRAVPCQHCRADLWETCRIRATGSFLKGYTSHESRVRDHERAAANGTLPTSPMARILARLPAEETRRGVIGPSL